MMNIVLIGLGMVATTHVTAIQSSDQGLKLRGVLGRDPARTASFAIENGTQAYASVAQIAGDIEIDFVISSFFILTFNSTCFLILKFTCSLK
jgi:predicted dehydrogenase